MKIHINQLQDGCILSENILSATNKPIAYKKTIVNQHIKDALQAFLINEVEVEGLLDSGEVFKPTYKLEGYRKGTYKIVLSILY